jgi:hypothetical protein
MDLAKLRTGLLLLKRSNAVVAVCVFVVAPVGKPLECPLLLGRAPGRDHALVQCVPVLARMRFSSTSSPALFLYASASMRKAHSVSL